MSQALRDARRYEEAMERSIRPEDRPAFHLSARVGWLNDPNGFSFYDGQYHMFYQYHPYDSHWGPMHWGHAVSRDLLHWDYLPAAMAPDMPYDYDGCYSGSALTAPDGRHLLMYTGVQRVPQPDGSFRHLQTQNLAFGDGTDYEKYAGNPVITGDALPPGGSPYDFRDPKLLRLPDGSYRALIANDGDDGGGRILCFDSPDAIQWRFTGVLAENRGRLGQMWECPDLCELDGQQSLLVSSQDMLPKGFEYHNGNGTFCLLGKLDGKNRLIESGNHAVDYGIDFYAPQTVLTPDGRRVMIGWMQNWDTCKVTGYEERPWFGQMSLPRELTIRDGRLYQQPIRELQLYRSRKVAYKDVRLRGKTVLEGISGRTVELEIHIRPEDRQNPYLKFTMNFAQNDRYHSILSFRPYESLVKIDRKFSGSRRAFIHQRRCQVADQGGELKLRVILDRFSAEVFINDGQQVMTATILTDADAKGIAFEADGGVVMDITKYTLFAEE